VNGVYKENRSHTRDGIPFYYLRVRTFMNEPEITFKLYRRKDGTDGTKRWWLNAFTNNGSGTLYLLYSASLDEANPDKPPMHGWELLNSEEYDGQYAAAGPPPIVLEIVK
jgi:hypothetical protein